MYIFINSTEIYVNFSQVLYSAVEADGMMTVVLEADGFSIWPFSAEVTPMEVGGPGIYAYYMIHNIKLQFFN